MRLSTIRHLWRFLTVFRVLARHDALFFVARLGPGAAGLKAIVRIARFGVIKVRDLPDDDGRRLALALRRLGPAYIKLGQMLATRRDLVGRDLARGLATLQDRLPPFSADEAVRTIEGELGAELNDRFASFEPEPVAAASIAQVHFAVTSSGEDVAVKVLRPGIRQNFERDLAAFRWAAEFLETHIPKSRRLRPLAVVKTVRESVEQELDLRLEGAAASELGENMRGEDGYRVPAIDWERTGRRVLTMERVTGIALNDVAALEAAGHDLGRLAGIIVQTFLRQAMRDGFFHADLHQGNLFVDDHGTVVALDFGIMGRLDRKTRKFLALILWGFLQKDYRGVASLHFDAGYIPPNQSCDRFAQALRAIAEPILGRSVNQISGGRLLAQLFATTEAFDMETQPHLLMLQRTMVMAEGMALHLDPEANLWDLSRPVLKAWVEENLTPEIMIADRLNEFRELLAAVPETARRIETLVARMEARDQGQGDDEPDTDDPGNARLMIASAASAAAAALITLAVVMI